MLNKQNFKNGQRVAIERTDSDLDGIEGTIIGKSMEHILDTYIVLLDALRMYPNGDTYRGLTMLESCLRPVRSC